MKQKRKSKLVWVDKCDVCGKEISAPTQPMVGARMDMHMLTHKKEARE